ncbi:hypothetical protein [uncultured Vagococcus sp.]|nr:hypothetical protein [uncultured Vagococcus sp.]
MEFTEKEVRDLDKILLYCQYTFKSGESIELDIRHFAEKIKKKLEES